MFAGQTGFMGTTGDTGSAGLMGDTGLTGGESCLIHASPWQKATGLLKSVAMSLGCLSSMSDADQEFKDASHA